ncbi:P-loop containing nucleoside triphosphate hydrolase protein [Whalleya microplaca]|nr:P-loop containing nucleoside triphosphate hydrolase protein [Whalleya microplaca]
MEMNSTVEKDVERFPVISLLGITGSGKSTLGARLAEDYNLYHLSVDDLLRDQCRTPMPEESEDINELAAQGEPIPEDLVPLYPSRELNIYMYLQRGQVVPPYLAFPVLARRIEVVARTSPCRGILLDGFPRELGHIMKARQFLPVHFMLAIHIACPIEVAEARYLQRARGNDDIAKFNMQAAHYKEHMRLVLKHFESWNQLVTVVVDGGMDADASYALLVTMLGEDPNWHRLVDDEVAFATWMSSATVIL